MRVEQTRNDRAPDEIVRLSARLARTNFQLEGDYEDNEMQNAIKLFEGGFTDIISVAPPGAALSPMSKLSADNLGKIPGRKLPDGTWVGFRNWINHETTRADAEQWDLDGANVGLRAERFPAIDIDCENESLSQQIAEIAHRILGDAPSRTGRAPKRLLLYKTNEPFRKVRLWIERPGNPTRHLVEILGTGQQFVVGGIHPSTMRPYEWNRDITTLGPTKLTTIDQQAVERFLNTLQRELEGEGYTCSREGRGGPKTNRSTINQESLKAPTIGELRKAVSCIPNTNSEFPGRDDYIRMGYAVRGAAQDEAGYEIFLDWAEQWEGNHRCDGNDPTAVRADWDSMKPPYEIGWDYIAGLARGHGYNDASLDFDSDLGDTEGHSPKPPRHSEQHLADIFVEQHRNLVRYIPVQKSWYSWDGVSWSRDTRRSAPELLKSTLRGVADEIARTAEADKARGRAYSLCTMAKVNSVLALASSDARIVCTHDELDADPWLLNTPSGIVDLRTAQLRPNDPEALFTKTTGVGVERGGQCETWRRFLNEVTRGDRALQEYLQRLAGYSLTGEVTEHAVIFIHGGGGNGKSVFLNTLAHVLGDYAVQAPMSTFLATSRDRHPTELAILRGARLVTASETDSRGRWNEARLKSLSGGDPITARFLYADFFTFQPQFKLVLVGNHKPQLGNVDDAVRRRLHLVPFTHVPERPDLDLPAKLRAEAGAILDWMIEGCLAWRREGLAPPPSVVAATAEYFEDEDTLGRWISERCDAAPTNHATTAELYEDWRMWCEHLGEDPGSQKRLSQLLKNRGFKKWREPNTRRMGFSGIAPRPKAPDLECVHPSEAVAGMPREVGGR